MSGPNPTWRLPVVTVVSNKQAGRPRAQGRRQQAQHATLSTSVANTVRQVPGTKTPRPLPAVFVSMGKLETA